MRFHFPVGNKWSELFYSEDRRLADYKKHGAEEEAAMFAASTLGNIAESMWESKINELHQMPLSLTP